MKRKLFFTIILLAVVICISAVASAQSAPRLKVDEITFNEKYTGTGSEGRPETGYFAAKWWKGQPQVMCYKSATRADIPAAMMEEMLDHLSARRPLSAAALADENFSRREFSLFNFSGAKTKVAVAPATDLKLKAELDALKAENKRLAGFKTELDTIKAELATAKAAEVKRLADAKTEADKKVKTPASTVSPLARELSACKATVKALEKSNAEAEKSLDEFKAALDKSKADLKTADLSLKAEQAGRKTDKSKADIALANAKADMYALSTVIWLSILALIIGIVIGVVGILSFGKK